jgi:hypothetical protein
VKAFATVACALAAASLAACVAQPQYAYRSPAPLPSADTGDTPDAAPSEPEARREANLARPGGKPTLDSLPGLRGAELTSLMGTPQFRHRDGKAEIWQYRGAACILDVFLYADGNDLRVRYVEARERGGDPKAKDGDSARQARICAGNLLAARANGAS